MLQPEATCFLRVLTKTTLRRTAVARQPRRHHHRCPTVLLWVSATHQGKRTFGAPLTTTRYATAGRLATFTAAASTDRWGSGDLPSTCRVCSWEKCLAKLPITSLEHCGKNDDHTIPRHPAATTRCTAGRTYTGPIRGRSPSPHHSENKKQQPVEVQLLYDKLPKILRCRRRRYDETSGTHRNMNVALASKLQARRRLDDATSKQRYKPSYQKSDTAI